MLLANLCLFAAAAAAAAAAAVDDPVAVLTVAPAAMSARKSWDQNHHPDTLC